jgi:hypothetical protein
MTKRTIVPYGLVLALIALAAVVLLGGGRVPMPLGQ